MCFGVMLAGSGQRSAVSGQRSAVEAVSGQAVSGQAVGGQRSGGHFDSKGKNTGAPRPYRSRFHVIIARLWTARIACRWRFASTWTWVDALRMG